MNKHEFLPIIGLILGVGLTVPSFGQDLTLPADEQVWISQDWVHIQALDKITARISDIYVPVMESTEFQAITISPQACYQHPPEQTPESAAHITLDERHLDQTISRIFEGWMFASSPGINSLEHPVYDVWIRGCLDEAP